MGSERLNAAACHATNCPMNTSARALCVIALGLLSLRCGSSGGAGTGGDGGDGADGNAGSDGSADAGSTDGASRDGTAAAADSSGDGGGCSPRLAQCARPPAGSSLCGSGAIDPAAAAAACNALDPPFDLNQGIPKACSAFSVTSGHYEVWCGPRGVYVWVAFDAIASSAVTTCRISAPLPDGGTATATYYKLSWSLLDNNDSVYAKLTLGDAGTTGGMLMKGAEPYQSSDQTTSASSWQGSSAFDGLLGGATAASGAGAVYFAADQQDCNEVPLPAGFQVVLAAPVKWGP